MELSLVCRDPHGVQFGSLIGGKTGCRQRKSWRLARLFVSEASLACTTSWIMCRFLLDRPNLTLDRSLV
ncbi:hypothetical protein M0657_006170 [Pyricularia oryzae]|nr:hypothetical protein MCOR09_010877 [Pyricularia oryzae]KAI7921191.1 hypothetical protein M0657_006170 [Pyricularia oryzae]KAI7931416.1 hypothetical protein M9X92_000247 [Pyricularia oryzae]